MSGGSEGGGIHILIPPFNEIFFSAIILLLIWLMVGKYALPKIYQILDEREKKIADGLAAAERAHEAEALAKRKGQEVVTEAHKDAHSIRQAAHDDSTRIVNDAHRDAQGEASRMTEGAQRQILAERESAEESLKSDVGMLAVELAERIVGEHLKDQALTGRVVDRFLDDLESSQTMSGEAGAHEDK